MLDRVLGSDTLRAEFVELRQRDSKLMWKAPSAKRYIAKVDSFLERFLLLIHVTAGQPARGTEILSLRHRNTVNGHHQNIFIEDSLVSTVTAYHKGYNIVGSKKIIHRYLPREVGELVVYYLWFILPFWSNLNKLVWADKTPPSPFLWSKNDIATWDSSRLTNVLREEARVHLQTHLNITYYRHAAIAMSRIHLKCGGFKQDYGVEEKQMDGQASHTTWIAGTIYARGLEEAPGAIEARRAEYARVSLEWHAFIGFRVYVPQRKRPLLFEPSKQKKSIPVIIRSHDSTKLIPNRLVGVVYRSGNRVTERWTERLVGEGVDESSRKALLRILGARQLFNIVDSNRIVAEFRWITRLIGE